MTIDQQSSNIYFSKFYEHIPSSYFCDIHLINTCNLVKTISQPILSNNCPEYDTFVSDRTKKNLCEN